MTIPLTQNSLNRHNLILQNVNIIERQTSTQDQKTAAYWKLWHLLEEKESIPTPSGILTREICGKNYEALTGREPWLSVRDKISTIFLKYLEE